MGDRLVWDMGGGPDPGGDPDGPTEVDRDGDGVQHQWQFCPLVKQVKVGLNHFFSYGQRDVMASFGVQSKNGNTLPLLFDITFDFFWLNLTFKRSLQKEKENNLKNLIEKNNNNSLKNLIEKQSWISCGWFQVGEEECSHFALHHKECHCLRLSTSAFLLPLNLGQALAAEAEWCLPWIGHICPPQTSTLASTAHKSASQYWQLAALLRRRRKVQILFPALLSFSRALIGTKRPIGERSRCTT